VEKNLLAEIFPRTFQSLTENERRAFLGEFSRKFPSTLEATQIAGLFPFFLSGKKWPDRGFIPDLAALEWALRLAEGAPKLPTQGFERVITATEPQWFSAQFRFDPAHAVMVSDWPLDEVASNPDASHERRPGKYLIYRSETAGPQVRHIDENEARLLEALTLGVPLGVILDRPGGPEFDAFLFHEWIQSGLLREIRWTDKSAPAPLEPEPISLEVMQ
jgi:hypothetical protein